MYSDEMEPTRVSKGKGEYPEDVCADRQVDVWRTGMRLISSIYHKEISL